MEEFAPQIKDLDAQSSYMVNTISLIAPAESLFAQITDEAA